MGFFSKYLRRYSKLFSLAIAILIFEAFCDLMLPTIIASIIDTGIANKDMDYVIRMGSIMLAITAAEAAAAASRNVISSNVALKFGADLRLDLYRKIQHLSFENLDRFENASLVNRLTNDITQVQNLTIGLTRIFVKAPLLFIGSIIMALRLNIYLSTVLFVVVPVVMILIYVNLHIGFPLYLKVQKALDGLNAVMREYLSGVRVVKAFNNYAFEISRFERANSEQAGITTTSMRRMAFFIPSVFLTVNLGVLAVLWFGGVQVSSGAMQVGQIVAFVNYMTLILFSLIMISFIFSTFVRAKASADRIIEVFDQEDAMKYARNSAPADVKGLIEFDNVSFSYSGYCGEPVLKNISFSCMPGETIAIIGSTGSGKSSLINLIPRFYDTCSGSVRVDGMDVKDIEIRELREKIALVPQKTVLFTGTILENIKWGKRDADMEEVIAAAAAAQAHSFVSAFPEGYETRLGQGGVNLSGGQKQRLAIARALIKSPEILILDDCTSSVDVSTEAEIRKALKKYFGKLTCIIVAQRITSVIDADRIAVLDKGELSCIGTHSELMDSCSVYKDIFHSQIGKEEI
ncbi:MAG: transporter [Firmicutes bacterium]|nr:transporter [Bacillota bacterium]